MPSTAGGQVQNGLAALAFGLWVSDTCWDQAMTSKIGMEAYHTIIAYMSGGRSSVRAPSPYNARHKAEAGIQAQSCMHV